MNTCQDCSKPISRYAKRCLSCARKGALNWQWDKATTKNPHVGRKAARLRFKLGPCQECGKPATDRHHKDDNPLNNAPSNVAILCRHCHMLADGRLAALAEHNEARRKYPDKAAKFRALRARRTAEGRPINKRKGR